MKDRRKGELRGCRLTSSSEGKPQMASTRTGYRVPQSCSFGDDDHLSSERVSAL